MSSLPDPKPLDVETSKSDRSGPMLLSDGPSEDVRTEIKEKVNLWRQFWQTRKSVFIDLSIARCSADELKASQHLSAWKFNIAQSVFAALPALLLAKVIGFIVPSQEPATTVTASMSFFQKAFAEAQPLAKHITDSMWPALFPFVLFLMARMIAWGSLKAVDASTVRRVQARDAYLYLDAAYGFFPQLFASIGLTLATLGGRSPLGAFGADADVSSGSGSWFIVGCYILGSAAFLVAGIWEYVLKRWILARKIFVFNGYSSKFKWFWIFREKGRNLAPWNKYIFALAYAAPTALFIAAAATGLFALGLALGMSALKILVKG